MYPQHYFSLIPAFPRDNTVFVAMSFAEQFHARWTEVIEPGIRRIAVNGQSLRPYRVDAGHVSDSILTDILKHISTARLVFCDITVIGLIGDAAIRNSNVMYELGLAHAVRQPEEVLIFRSDAAPLVFDLSNVRVNEYQPDTDPRAAQEAVASAVKDALTEIDLRKALAVEQISQRMDYAAWLTLLQSVASNDAVTAPVVRTMRDALGGAATLEAIRRMLEFGVLATELANLTPESVQHLKEAPLESIVSYRVTPLGRAVRAHGIQRLEKVAALMGEFDNTNPGQ